MVDSAWKSVSPCVETVAGDKQMVCCFSHAQCIQHRVCTLPTLARIHVWTRRHKSIYACFPHLRDGVSNVFATSALVVLYACLPAIAVEEHVPNRPSSCGTRAVALLHETILDGLPPRADGWWQWPMQYLDVVTSSSHGTPQPVHDPRTSQKHGRVDEP